MCLNTIWGNNIMSDNTQNKENTNNETQSGEHEQASLFELFTRIEWIARRHQLHRYMQHGPMADPHRGQGRVLTLLKMKPEISQKDLSYLLDMRPQSLGELLTKLEKGGYITRTPSESDRRVMIIKLTEQGKTAAEDVEPVGGQDAMFDCLSEQEQKNMADYLTRILQSMEEQMKGDMDWRGFGRDGQPPQGFPGWGGCEGRARPDFGGEHARRGFDRDGMRRDGRFVPLDRRGNGRGGMDPRAAQGEDAPGHHSAHGEYRPGGRGPRGFRGREGMRPDDLGADPRGCQGREGMKPDDFGREPQDI